MAAVGGATAVISALFLLTIQNRYQATVLLVPEATTTPMPSALTSLAAVAGLPVAGLAPESPQFYVSLVRSRPVQYAVLSSRFPAAYVFRARTDSSPLLDLLRIRGKTPSERLWKGEKTLDRLTNVSADIRTGIVSISVETTSPPLSAAVANAFADELQHFNQQKRQSHARARRVFLASQVDSADRQLTSAEGAVRDFLERNRLHSSPALDYDLSRLQRNVTLDETRYVQLRSDLDAAALAEVDNTPVLTVIQRAIVPAQKTSPRRTTDLALITILVVGLTVVGTVLADGDPGLAAEMRSAWSAVVATFPRFPHGRRAAP